MTMWKAIPGYERYEISEDGAVRRSENYKKRGALGHEPGSLMKISHPPNRYRQVSLSNPGRRNKRVWNIHELMALTFISPKPNKNACACHKDDDRENNHISNIYWGTKKENAEDASKNKRIWWGKLTPIQVSEIKRKYKTGTGLTSLGKEFGITKQSIKKIIDGRSYGWVE